MTEGQEHEWHIELDEMRTRLRYALDNLDSIERRKYVQHQIEQVYGRLKDLVELTKGEMK
jgi:hypothetical protein